MNPNSRRYRRAIHHQGRRIRQRSLEIFELYVRALIDEYHRYHYPDPLSHPDVQRAIQHHWPMFKPWLPLLYRRLHWWKAHREAFQGTLTGCAWHVASEVYALQGLALMGFNEHRQTCYLRKGLITLCTVLIDYRLP